MFNAPVVVEANDGDIFKQLAELTLRDLATKQAEKSHIPRVLNGANVDGVIDVRRINVELALPLLL